MLRYSISGRNGRARSRPQLEFLGATDMKATYTFSLLVDELAGHWTEPALEILKAAGISHISVDMELATWRALRQILGRELLQRPYRSSTVVSVRTLMEEVLRDAVITVASGHHLEAASYEFEKRVQILTSGRRLTDAERRVVFELVRQPVVGSGFKPPSRSDFTPRLQAAAH